MGGGTMGLSESLNLSVNQVGLDNLTMSESKTDQLKAAFLFYCKRNIGQATSIVEDLFPLTSQQQESEIDSSLNKMVVQMSQDIIDDYPASDPRWMESLPASQQSGTSRVGSSMSLLIRHQLEDKKMALDLTINFLKEVGLWNRVRLNILFKWALLKRTFLTLNALLIIFIWPFYDGQMIDNYIILK